VLGRGSVDASEIERFSVFGLREVLKMTKNNENETKEVSVLLSLLDEDEGEE
jgi:hypothetical protein